MIRRAVVVPCYKDRLSWDERISSVHLAHYLHEEEKIIVIPDTLRTPPLQGRAERFPARYFESTATYSRMLLSKEFYGRFRGYDYILVHQLDALVFADALYTWCNQDVDYVGAPIQRVIAANRSALFVGNGGLSLRGVEACMRVLSCSKPAIKKYITVTAAMPDLVVVHPLVRLIKILRLYREMDRGAQQYADSYSLNEDLFWSLRARCFDGSFRIAGLMTAARFAMEHNPRLWYERIGNVLPFGCHAWMKWDRAFWKPHLLHEQ